MEISRLFLLSALFLVAFMLWNAWQNEHPSSKLPPVSTTQVITPEVTPPVAAVTTQAPSAAAAASQIAAPPVSNTKPLVHIQTDVLDLLIDTQGNVARASLLKYPQTLNSPTPFVLLSDDPENLYIAQSGLIGKQGPDTTQGQAHYTTSQKTVALSPSANQLNVDLHWQKNGVSITKRFILKRGSYQIGVNYLISNNSSATWSSQLYAQLQRKKPAPHSQGLFAMNPYVGAAISTQDEPYQKISFDKLSEQNLNFPVQGGWIAMLEHYFLGAWIPPTGSNSTFYSEVTNENIYTLGFISNPVVISPGAQGSAQTTLYLGPEITDQLKTIAPNLDRTIDYGFLWFIASALLLLLKHIESFIGNWGWSIVLVTVLIKLCFYHLSAKSYRSMAGMRKLQPRLQALRERYANDRQKMTQATMELYRAEKINPMSGCLPIIVQIPVFIALYWVLLESVELRQAPFILWIHDLSAKDPYYVLPVLMGLSMWIQQKLNPPPPDPTQAKVMQFLPIFFTFLFLNFPSGLVLYWFVNNALSILQQWHIMQQFGEKKKKR